MDAELKQYLDANFANVMDLITSQSTEMAQGFKELRHELKAIQARLDLQGGKLRAGSVWMTRIDEWSDRADHLNVERDETLAELRSQMRRLESRISELEKPKP